VTPNISPFRPGGRYFGPLIGVVALAIVAALASFVFFGGQEPVEEPEPVVEAVPPPPPPATPPPVEEPEEEVALPSLDDSDSLVRDFVAALTSHPAFAAWLIPDQLVRTFVLVVENAADGNNPAAGLTPLRPTQRFSVRGEAPAPLSVNPASYARYNTHAEIVASINPVGAAELYRRLYPLITEAYAELGHPDGGFDNTLLRALRNLLETPVLERDVALVPRATFFEFANDELENLHAVQKQFLGMGPRNVRAVQASLLDIAREIGIDPGDLPTPEVVR
jgi:hypothetical protein